MQSDISAYTNHAFGKGYGLNWRPNDPFTPKLHYTAPHISCVVIHHLLSVSSDVWYLLTALQLNCFTIYLAKKITSKYNNLYSHRPFRGAVTAPFPQLSSDFNCSHKQRVLWSLSFTNSYFITHCQNIQHFLFAWFSINIHRS